MTVLDWIIIFTPPVILVGALSFRVLDRLIDRMRNPNIAIGLFGVVLCWGSAAAYTLLLSESAKEMTIGFTVQFFLAGAFNFLLFILGLIQPDKSEK